MQMHAKKSLLCYAVVVLLLASSQALAGSFCAVSSLGTDCRYLDVESCQRAANQARGTCVVNSKEVRPPSGSNPFCAVSSLGTDCRYLDAESCQRAAAQQRGTCVVNPNHR